MLQRRSGTESINLLNLFYKKKNLQMYKFFLTILLIFTLSALIIAEETGTKVELQKGKTGKWQILVDNKPFFIKGVGRMDQPDIAQSCKVNTIRRYNSRDIAHTFKELEAAKARNMKIIRGIVVGRESKTFSYGNPDDVKRQRERVRKKVKAFRDHPALLCWGLGNESERITATGKNTKYWREIYWKELNELAKIIKQEDPHHPVMNVIAGNSPKKMEMMKKFAPEIDIIGINSYAAAVLTSQRLDTAKWNKPFILTEFGPRGHWEVPKTSWGAPIEPSSEAKAANYSRGYHAVIKDPRCLGTVCFVWSNKQEITRTWYGMFLETGEKTPAVDTIALLYSGRPLPNLSPRIKTIISKLDRNLVKPGEIVSAEIIADDNENDSLSYEWKVTRESGVKWAIGAYEPIPPIIPGCIFPPGNTAKIKLRTPVQPGAYRLFVFVRDGNGGGATQNLPFLVADIKESENLINNGSFEKINPKGEISGWKVKSYKTKGRISIKQVNDASDGQKALQIDSSVGKGNFMLIQSLEKDTNNSKKYKITLKFKGPKGGHVYTSFRAYTPKGKKRKIQYVSSKKQDCTNLWQELTAFYDIIKSMSTINVMIRCDKTPVIIDDVKVSEIHY